MYAVIETGGKQYRVEVGTELGVELLDVEPGQSVTLERVLLIADGDETSVGRPLVANAAVAAEVVRRDRGEKLIVFKYRPKARSRVKKGHRQDHTILRINDITLNGKSAAEASRTADRRATSERQRLEEAAARQAAADAELAARLAADRGQAEGPKRGRTAKPAPPEATPETSEAPKRGASTKAADAAVTEERATTSGGATTEDPAPASDAAATNDDATTGETATTDDTAATEASATTEDAVTNGDTAATEATGTRDEASAETPERTRTKKDE